MKINTPNLSLGLAENIMYNGIILHRYDVIMIRHTFRKCRQYLSSSILSAYEIIDATCITCLAVNNSIQQAQSRVERETAAFI